MDLARITNYIFLVNIKHEKLSEPRGWEWMMAEAKRRGGRLATLKEARSYLKTFPNGRIYTKQVQWAAVSRSDGGKDWMQTSNAYSQPGTSWFEKNGSYPNWGATGGKYGRVMLMWFPSTG